MEGSIDMTSNIRIHINQKNSTKFHIHITKFDMYKNLNTMDDLVKNKFGYKIDKDQINIINDVIKKSLVEFKKNEIDKFLNENFYNNGKTIKFFDENLSNICN